MSSRRKKNRVKKYNNFKKLKNISIPLHKLDMHKNLIDVLNKIKLYDNDIISRKLLDDNKNNSISVNINWLNLTKSTDHISYTTSKDNIWKKENRKPVLIKKLIRKLYGKTFSNKQIKSFLSKYKKAYNEFVNYNKTNKLTSDDKIILKIMTLTSDEDIKWYIDTKNNNYIKYVAYLLIDGADNKSIRIEYYEMFMKDSKSFLSFKLVNDKVKTSEFIRSLTDSKLINDLLIYIKISTED